MKPVTVEHTIDVTCLPPRERHPTILKAWNQLDKGSALVLCNDHDPLPLYYQFACENPGEFQWEYLDNGPDLWRVRITKGDFANAGFIPARKPAGCGCSTVSMEPRVVDTRPLFAQGESPCQAIDDAVAALTPGQPLVLLVPFEPVPLYAKLGNQGFQREAKQLPDGTWRIEFRRRS